MKVTELVLYQCEKPTCVAVGVFDGVHLGHTKIIERLCNAASETGTVSTLLTFSDHPRIVLDQHAKLKLLNTMEEKIAILRKTQLRQVVVIPFSKEFASLDAHAFVKSILIDKLHVHTIIVGYDHRFGKNRSSSLEDLIKYGNTYGFSVEEIPAQEINNIAVSSTKIRLAIAEGNIDKANSYMGYDFMLTGTVVEGNKIGRRIGFPTANIRVAPSKIIPKDGVYVAYSYIDGKKFYGMMNIGRKPTLKNTEKTIEIHFFDFDGILYGKEISVELIRRLRDEVAFPSMEALQNQLQKDYHTAKNLIRNLKLS